MQWESILYFLSWAGAIGGALLLFLLVWVVFMAALNEMRRVRAKTDVWDERVRRAKKEMDDADDQRD